MSIKEDYQFNITVKNFKKLKPIAKKTRMRPYITEKKGLPFFLNRYRKRKVFFAGIFICCILVYIMSLFIWDINILGGSKHTPEAVMKFLSEKDVFTGMKKKTVDCQEIEETLRLAYKDIGWVSAEVKGTRLIIKITETNMPAPAGEAIEPSHIVAIKPGIIDKIITRAGTPMVKVGDVVKPGDILVSGIITTYDDFQVVLDKKPIVADASILCKTYYDYHDVFSMKYIEKIYTGEKKKGYYITLLLRKIFLYNPRYSYDNYDIIVNENKLHITDSFYLPMQIGTVTAMAYEEEKRTYSEEEASTIAKDRLKRYFDQLLEKGVQIEENNVKITIENNSCKAEGRIVVKEPAWEYKTILESEWRIEQTDEHNGDDH
jgi:similar to stage IV sporulation protein